MRALILDSGEAKRMIRRRKAKGADRFDEVWNGVYVMSPLADIEHQDLVTLLAAALLQAIGGRAQGMVLAGTNVSDRPTSWRKNYRCPDVAVFLPGNPAKDKVTHWLGGPDFAVEILSPQDRGRKKAPFYASAGTRELLVINRKPWSLELMALQHEAIESLGTSDVEHPQALQSSVLPVTFRLLEGTNRPAIEIRHSETGQTWIA